MPPPNSDGWSRAIAELRSGIDQVFGALIDACATSAQRLDARPADGGWSAREVLEHVSRTDHFLLVLIDKIATRTRKRIAVGAEWPAHTPRFGVLQSLASRERSWDAPEHMVPSGDVAIDDVRRALADDRTRCVSLLDAFPRGEATLHRIRMSAVEDDDDRLDMYQFVEIVRLHAARHLAQIERAYA